MGTFEVPAAGVERQISAPHLRRLSLTDFRNFEGLECELPAPGVAIIGPNGSGKTNLLEAVYYLEIFRSFRGVPDSELVRFGADVFRVEASLASGAGERRVTASYERSGRRKKVSVDGREAERLSDAVGALGAVVFRLQDVEIVRGGPAERRRFLNVLLSLSAPGYLAALQRYRSVLSQRNEALRRGARSAEIEPWTEGMLGPGARVMAARSRWVAGHDEAFGEYYTSISGGASAEVRYDPSVGWGDAAAGGPGDPEAAGAGPGDEAVWEARFAAALRQTGEREMQRGVTLVGPQRDDVALRRRPTEGEARDLRSYGSSGQQRTAALALRLVEADTLRDRHGREPLYLLDDVFAELDEDRSSRLLDLLDAGRTGQVILTAPKAGEVELRGGDLARWGIRNGRLLT